MPISTVAYIIISNLNPVPYRSFYIEWKILTGTSLTESNVCKIAIHASQNKVKVKLIAAIFYVKKYPRNLYWAHNSCCGVLDKDFFLAKRKFGFVNVYLFC